MVTIKAKKRPVIKKGEGYVYDPATFKKEHKVDNFYEVEDPQDILKQLKPFEFNGRKFITFDTETHPYFKSSQEVPETVVRRWVGSGKHAVPQDFPFCISICDGTNAFTIYDSVKTGFKKFKQLAPIFEDASIEKIAHNWKFDAHMLANIGMKMVGRIHDTVVLTKLVDENRRSFDLKSLASRKKNGIVKFEYMVDSYKQLNKVKDYRLVPRELLSEYANADVWNCYITFIDEYPKLIEQNLEPLYDKECELMIVLYAMERYGMRTDSEYEIPLKNSLQQKADEAEQAIYDEAGEFFNINSTKQLYNILLKLGVNRNWIELTEKGNPRLDKEALNKLADVHQVSLVKKILEYRKNEKLLNTYAIGIYDQKDKAGRVHGNINQTEATTGRMSMTKPPLQTLPKKNKSIRRIFIPDEDYELYFMDLDQVEYRLFSHYAKIPSLIEAIKNGYDVHAATAAMIFNIDLEELLDGLKRLEECENKLKDLKQAQENLKDYDLKIEELDKEIKSLQKYADMRSKGKTINFALIYGVGNAHLGNLLNCTVTEATNLKIHYFSQLPEAKIFIATVHQVIKERGYVRNFYGRRRRLSVDDSYKAPNALIQGCAADYLKHKLVDMYKYIRYNNLKTRLLLPVHDEVVIMAHKDELEHIPVLRWIMSDFNTFRCSITAGLEKGNPSWGQKILPDNMEFKKPNDTNYTSYNIFDGHVFNIYKEDSL